MLKRPSPGKVYIYSSDPKEFYFLMWNFDIDRDELKNEHKTLLDEKIISYLDYASLLGWPLQVKLYGHTSATGSEKHNMDLARRRIASVRKHLKNKGKFGSVVKFVEKPLGEKDRISAMFARMLKSAAPPGDEEAVDRAVRLQVIRWNLIGKGCGKLTDANWAEAFSRIEKAIRGAASISAAIPDWIKIKSSYHKYNVSPPHRESQKKVEQQLKDKVAIRVCQETYKVLLRYGCDVNYEEVVKEYLRWDRKRKGKK